MEILRSLHHHGKQASAEPAISAELPLPKIDPAWERDTPLRRFVSLWNKNAMMLIWTTGEVFEFEHLGRRHAGIPMPTMPDRSVILMPGDGPQIDWTAPAPRDHLPEAADDIQRRDAAFKKRAAKAPERISEPSFQLSDFAVELFLLAGQGPINIIELARELMAKKRYLGNAKSLERQLRRLCQKMGIKMRLPGG